jgi:hypothetical protein
VHWRQLRPLLPAPTEGWDRAKLAEQDRLRALGLLQPFESRLRRLQSWRQDAIEPVAAGSFWLRDECNRDCDRDAGLNVERAKTEQASSQFEEFAIDPESVRFVADDQTYAISGAVTGPCSGEARIRVWLGDPVTGYKLRDPTLGTETLVSGCLIVDLPGGYNVFSLVLDEFQLPANIPAPPSSADPWVLTASAVGGEAESDPVLLPLPEYACSVVASSTQVSLGAAIIESDRLETLEKPIISDPPLGGVTVLDDTTYEIRGVQTRSSSLLLIEAWPMAYGERVASARPFATVLDAGETEFSVLVKLLFEGSNSFVVRATDLNSGMESAVVSVPKIMRRQAPRPGKSYHPKKRYG